MERLGNYIVEYSVRNKSNEEIPVFSVTNEKGFCTGYFDKEVASKERKSYKIVPKGYFAYNPSRINVGSVDWQRVEDRVIVSPLYVVFGVSSKIMPQYLYYFLKSGVAKNYIQQKSQGSVRNNFKFSMLADMELPIPSIDKQNDIVKMLNKIQKITTLKTKELSLINTAERARFVEMFESNREQWDQRKLSDCCNDSNDIKCGPFGSQLHAEDYCQEGVPVYGIPEVNAQFKVRPKLYITKEKAEELTAYSLLKGDIAVSRKGNVGQAALFDDAQSEGIIHSDVLRIRLNQQIMQPLYLVGELHYSQRVLHQIQSVSSGAIMPGTNVKKLKSIIVDVPPLELQNEYADFVDQVDKSKAAIQKSIDETQFLYDSLMQKYFG